MVSRIETKVGIRVKTITEPMEPIACWTCIRSMLEPCARAAWMLDPSIDADTRIKRTTGWEVTLDLIRKLAKLCGETCDPAPELWYRKKFERAAEGYRPDSCRNTR